MFRDFLLEDREEGRETRQEEIAMSWHRNKDRMPRSHGRDMQNLRNWMESRITPRIAATKHGNVASEPWP